MAGPRIVVAAHKGGVGKTTVSAALAGALAVAGRQVLAVDTDPQGGLGAVLGAPTPDKPTLYEVLTGRAPATRAVITTTAPRVLLLPSDLDAAACDLELPRRSGWRLSLVGALDTLPADRIDVTLIDSPPGLGVLPVVALSAATHVIVVTELDFLSIRSLPSQMATIRQVVSESGGTPRLIGIVPSRADLRTRASTDALDLLHEQYAGWVLPSMPVRASLREAGTAGRTISLYEPGGVAARAAESLAQEVVDRALTTPEPA
jgi:chromosome partitioning protein